MSKHSVRRAEPPPRQDSSQTLAWRGIGCLLMIITPAISIVSAILTIGSSLVQYIPYQLMGYPVLPDYFFATDGLAMIFSPIVNIENLYAIILVSAAYTMLLGGLISVVYATIYRIVNPNRYGAFDAPPPNVKAKKYQR